MPPIPSGGLITEDNFSEFVDFTKEGLLRTIADGQVPEFVGEPMTAEAARDYALNFLDTHKATFIEGSLDWLAALAQRLVVSEGPDESIEEFEALLTGLTDEQLTELAESEADNVEALKADVIDRRRKLVADLMAAGRTLLRGAVATGLFALQGALGPGGVALGAGVGAALGGGEGGPADE